MPAVTKTLKRARQLRRTMTPPELRLWVALRSSALEGLKFRRQHPEGSFVLDFYCASAKLAVEVDGEGHWHSDQVERDRIRDVIMTRSGITTLRIEAQDVLHDLEGVLHRIAAAAKVRD